MMPTHVCCSGYHPRCAKTMYGRASRESVRKLQLMILQYPTGYRTAANMQSDLFRNRIRPAALGEAVRVSSDTSRGSRPYDHTAYRAAVQRSQVHTTRGAAALRDLLPAFAHDNYRVSARCARLSRSSRKLLPVSTPRHPPPARPLGAQLTAASPSLSREMLPRLGESSLGVSTRLRYSGMRSCSCLR